ncbi:MAG: gliding motility-associated C-terminal domain-containing protein [Owenweeksia sp.]|nr:gliding motility-associated C-terminal domain-containing protein [Owenweeksia sp.]
MLWVNPPPPYQVRFSDLSGPCPVATTTLYRVSATDSCGGRDTLSNLGRNILLQVEERSNLTNYLTWNPYQKWDGDVSVYNIYRKADQENDYSKVGQVKGNDTTYVDNIKDYRDSEGNFCYYVEAVEGNNSLGIVNDQGLPYTSLSNQACMNQSAKVFMPTGFRPGSDIAENRTFGPSLRFEDVEKYHFYIMNRWGVKIFETRDPEVRWDGTQDGEDASQGVYIYYLEYATPGGQTKEQRGSFTLVR